MACKKDTAISVTESLPINPSARYKLLTENYWRLVHVYQDTSLTARNNPSLLPLLTTFDAIHYSDSCAYYTGEKFNAEDGKLYGVKGNHCYCPTPPPCLVSYYPGLTPASNTTSWRLSNNDTKIHYGNDQTGEIIYQLDNSTLIYYHIGLYTNVDLKITMRVYKSYKDW